ncbi:hypothetical protein BDV37DRAFT_246814 [Aspergillus pseudonomiae]|uniref:Uncharacterized protein n=1 Tax=Aspergillus pseudonomiae TaxID=1506151 RepID=A0A5N7DEV9_9EURO|nr:uncharacterized protein BDV37DRAFT_246814 [Aspergillus pseudonomiae]KAE8404725.1 hypothetical protein BDV37DRAFT_246814 [Aspergillus pseudonomiae]
MVWCLLSSWNCQCWMIITYVVVLRSFGGLVIGGLGFFRMLCILTYGIYILIRGLLLSRTRCMGVFCLGGFG